MSNITTALNIVVVISGSAILRAVQVNCVNFSKCAEMFTCRSVLVVEP